LTRWLLVAAASALLAGCSDETAPTDAEARHDAQVPAPDQRPSVDQDPAKAPEVTSISPTTQAGGVAFELTVHGARLGGGTVLLDGTALVTTVESETQARAQVPAQKRGARSVAVRTPAGTSAAVTLTIENAAPVIGPVADQTASEEAPFQLTLTVSDPDGDPLRVFVSGLPPGARFDEASRELRFVPDFTQGGDSFTVNVTASDGQAQTQAAFKLTIKDTIAPPSPTVVSTIDAGTYVKHKLQQKTDSYLDSPGHAGRSFEAWLGVPKSASASSRKPVRVTLHGYDNAVSSEGSGGELVINAQDSMNTYWWGYSDQLPGGAPTQGTVPPYTLRRVLHLLEWVLRTQPGADPEAVYVSGSSMGGAGALTLGLLGARHFCYVEGIIGQTIPRNHRPLRVAQLSGLWGTPQLNLPVTAGGVGVWDWQDLTRALKESPEARDQFIFTKHGKDDDLIHFGAVVQASPLTKLSFYQALPATRPGFYVVWDEGGHGPADPVLGDFWSDWGWSRVSDAVTYLRRDRAFPAFAKSSADQSPGDGTGNGKQSWDVNKGYAGAVSVPGDTGWSGELAGALNRFLRWGSAGVVDTESALELPLWVLSGSGKPAPQAGYPSIGNQLDAALPITVDVTPRRVQRFRCLPGEEVTWTFGGDSGSVTADGDGAVTVPGLKLTTTPTTLKLRRAP